MVEIDGWNAMEIPTEHKGRYNGDTVDMLTD